MPLSAQATFSSVQDYVIAPKCLNCHSGPGSPMGVDLSSYEPMMVRGLIVPGQPEASPFYLAIATGRMPKGGPPVSAGALALIYTWIQAGASENGAPVPPAIPIPPAVPTYDWISKYVFQRGCIGCHDGSHEKPKLDLRTYEALMAFTGEFLNPVEPGEPDFSTLVSNLRAGLMPPPAQFPKLPNETINAIAQWIADGAKKGTP